jgi:hypothetical protein
LLLLEPEREGIDDRTAFTITSDLTVLGGKVTDFRFDRIELVDPIMRFSALGLAGCERRPGAIAELVDFWNS